MTRPDATFSLRVSLLEQCQYDCGYCRPGSVRRPTPPALRLTAAEYARLAPLFVARGVRKVRFTGGEPLLRPDFVEVVRAFRAAAPGLRLALTTNGERLPLLAEAVQRAGLDAVTGHVDSLRPERYRALMGDGDVNAVVAGLLEAKARGLEVKLNVVVQRGRNEDELEDFLAWSARHGVEVRFIELMNTGSAAPYVREAFVPGREVLARLGGARPLARRHPADPAALFARDGVTFGLIASDTQPFCTACDRLRLSAAGLVRGCLYEAQGVALGSALRAGASDADLARLLGLALAQKRSHHPSVPTAREAFSMADAGG